MKKHRRALVWMRRAFRVDDNTVLHTALHEADDVVPVVCLRDAAHYADRTPRRQFLRSVLVDLDGELRKRGSMLHVLTGDPADVIPAAAQRYSAGAVYAARVYDPGQQARDKRINRELEKTGRLFLVVDDHVLRGASDVLTRSGTPYRVYTPFRRAWMDAAEDIPRPAGAASTIKSPPVAPVARQLASVAGFAGIPEGGGERRARIMLDRFLKSGLASYEERRDLPGVEGTSRLSAHISVGAISIRKVYWEVYEAMRGLRGPARRGAETFVGEILWREFYYQILSHFPYVASRSFREEMESLPWSTRKDHFDRWRRGETGYPIVDAGMRQLQSEGWMHNRVRMIVASFLTKDLHINWQWGERHFARHLVDADLASNNGGWQWTAGTGTDASPWFRIFNPVAQARKFDPDGLYVRKYVPELAHVPAAYVHEPAVLDLQDQTAYQCRIGIDYPEPIVDHRQERAVTMALYSRKR